MINRNSVVWRLVTCSKLPTQLVSPAPVFLSPSSMTPEESNSLFFHLLEATYNLWLLVPSSSIQPMLWLSFGFFSLLHIPFLRTHV